MRTLSNKNLSAVPYQAPDERTVAAATWAALCPTLFPDYKASRKYSQSAVESVSIGELSRTELVLLNAEATAVAKMDHSAAAIVEDKGIESKAETCDEYF